MVLGINIIIGIYTIYLVYNNIYSTTYIHKYIGRVLPIHIVLRKYALLITIIIYYIVLLWWYMYDSSIVGYQILGTIYSIVVGIDSISLYYIILLAILLPITILASWNTKYVSSNMYYVILVGIGILLLLNFICIDILSFYILFESTLIPLFILIGMYGSIYKYRAAYYILLYTLGNSLFMLLSICISTYILHSTSYYIYSEYVLSIDIQILLFLGVFIGIMVKTPIYPLHIWLPVVHSESPLGGSILLAGLILKLTIYLIVRWVLPFYSEASILYTPAIYILAIITIIIISMITIVQVDLKIIIAYSSISHMAVCILGIFSNTLIGIEGSYILSIAHGFVSPALFICVGGILYDRYHTRIVYYYSGILSIMPTFALYFILLSFANIGTPLSINFIGEFLSMYGAFTNNTILATIATISILLSATYQLKLTNRITGGTPLYISSIGDITHRESLILITIILCTLLLGIYPHTLLSQLYIQISSILYIL
uniref:NADH-ubiquinone oxidoreductase chain 4 n=1 Tax=Diddensiella santjacobensis TaxID=2704139 RepID=S5U3Y7_9ASCO|nr:NADH dehydrogenase subunit 4 [Diddensiella santjacobensis]AGS44128.1 NADH dehydrogenase subunit 4 [Diddensiella santjacobensis]